MTDERDRWMREQDALERIRNSRGGVKDTEIFNYEHADSVERVLDGLWLVEDWLPRAGVAALYGHPGSGKSFLATSLAACVSAGATWAGKHVEKGLVLYVVAEGQMGFRNRLAAMQEVGDVPRGTPFVFVPTPIDLQAAVGHVDKLIRTLRHASEELNAEPALVVIDTLSKTFGAGKENTDDMAGYVANCQRIASTFDCLTLVVHHRPKDTESRDLRGHSSLKAGVDTAILIDAGPIKTATTIKQKDGEDNLRVRFRLDRVSLGFNSRGKEVTTCLVNFIEDENQPILDKVEQDKRRLTGHSRTALHAIQNVLADKGQEPPVDIPADSINRYKTARAVEAGHVMDRLEAEFLSLVDSAPDSKADTASRTARRVLGTLKAKKILGSWKEWLWIN